MKYVDKVNEYLRETANSIADEFILWVTTSIEEFEIEQNKSIISPVEQLFYIAWYKKLYVAHDKESLNYLLEPQYSHPEKTGKYRLDFMVDVFGYYMNYSNTYPDERLMSSPDPLVAVEIDGHEWHEKTKEQVTYHKQRERFLVSKGWRLFRYSGSEVYRDPDGCINDLSENIRPIADQWLSNIKKPEGDK